MQRRRLCPSLSAIAVVTALALVLVLVLGGCGAAASPAAQVRSAWTTFKRALIDGDAKRVCAMLNDTSRIQLMATIAQISPPSSSSCDSAAQTLFDVNSGDFTPDTWGKSPPSSRNR